MTSFGNNVSTAAHLRLNLRLNPQPMADESKGEVFSSLPRSRPVRRSSKRDGSARDGGRSATAAASSGTEQARSAKPGGSKRAASGGAKRAAKPGGSAQRTAAAKRGGSAKRTAAAKRGGSTKKRAASGGSAGGAAARKQTTASAPRSAAPKRKSAPKAETPPAGWATPEDAGGTPAGPAEIATTAVRAVGELAQIGVAVGGQAVKGVLKRIPRP